MDGHLPIDGKQVRSFAEPDPARLPGRAGVDIASSTGFRDREGFRPPEGGCPAGHHQRTGQTPTSRARCWG